MATPVAVGDIVQVTPRFEIEGQQCENVLYFQCYNADPDMLANLLLKIAQCLITSLIPHLGSNFQLTSVKGKIVGPALGLEDEWFPEAGALTIGAESGDSEPSYVSAVISLHTTRPGRSGRGRMYIGGIPESQTTLSKINIEGPLWAALLAFITCMMTAFPRAELGSGANYAWGVLSRKVAGVTKPPFPTTAFAEVTRAVPQQYLGTTRSRKVGHGK